MAQMSREELRAFLNQIWETQAAMQRDSVKAADLIAVVSAAVSEATAPLLSPSISRELLMKCSDPVIRIPASIIYTLCSLSLRIRLLLASDYIPWLNFITSNNSDVTKKVTTR